MKAITLWQPWASLLACGAKKYETRSWATNYRGPIGIHAAKKTFDTDPYFDRELYVFADALGLTDIYSFDTLPHGCIIAVTKLAGCHKMVLHGGRGLSSTSPGWLETDAGVYEPTDQELLFGDWTPGRYAWEFKDMTMLPKPIPAKGKQGLWNWDIVTVKKHGAMGRSELSALDFTAKEDMCVICGSYVPEGRMVCPTCEADPFHALKKKGGAL